MKMFDAQSQELDPKKRLALNAAIQKRLEADAARPILDWKVDYFTVWPHVKNLIPHQSIYNFGRMQEVWRDKKLAGRLRARESLRHPAALHRRSHLAGHVGGDLHPAAPGARRHRRHPLLH